MPVALRDREGRDLVLGMYWDFTAKQWRHPATVPFGALHAVSIAVVDWDRDGDTDLVAGTADGEVWRWTHSGTPQHVEFDPRAEPVVVGGEPLALASGHAMPTVADWDQDGRFDLVVGGDDGQVSWARNVGSRTRPEFAALETLVAPADGAPGRSRRNALVEVADLNGDGRVDLLVGDQEQEELLAGRTEAQAARYAELQGQFASHAEVRRVLAGKDEAAKAALGEARVEAFRDYSEELRALTPKRKSSSGVWFYARAPASGARGRGAAEPRP